MSFWVLSAQACRSGTITQEYGSLVRVVPLDKGCLLNLENNSSFVIHRKNQGEGMRAVLPRNKKYAFWQRRERERGEEVSVDISFVRHITARHTQKQ